MKNRFVFLTVLAVTLSPLGSASAQGLRLPPTATLAASNTANTATQADFIVAVVNSEPITNAEVRREIQRVQAQLAQLRRPQPPIQELASEVLESLINLKAQVQLAREMGLRIEDSAIDQTELTIAQQNQIEVAELHRRLQNDGFSVTQFRSQLHDQLLQQRLRDREVESRVRVSDLDIDQYLEDQKNNFNPDSVQINLAQILVAVPESATETQIAALRMRAQQVLKRAKAGENFANLVHEYSDIPAPSNDGLMGLREVSRYPTLFVQATQALNEDEVADLVHSPAGFHVLKVVKKNTPGMPAATVTESHARHILLRPSASLSETEAQSKLANFKKQVLNGVEDFAALARTNSQDSSAQQGGDLGWVSPGMFVPEFEGAMNRLAPGEISDPLVSRFGVHLIQLLERRKVNLNPAQLRESVRAVLHEKKFGEAYLTWAQEVRARAYVELRDAPQ